jgi:hypothetical protein
LVDKKELTLDLKSNSEIFHEKQRETTAKGDVIINKISLEQIEEYKKFLKKNVPNSFVLD